MSGIADRKVIFVALAVKGILGGIDFEKLFI
jgi:hypothetical protein